MKKKNLLSSAVLVGALASSVTQSANATSMHKSKSSGKIHCKGISTKWVNDCGANGHECAGAAKSNFDSNEWLYMPSEDCKMVQNALKNKAVRSYVERIQKGTVVAIKRGKKF